MNIRLGGAMKNFKLVLSTVFFLSLSSLGASYAQSNADPSKPKPVETPTVHLTRREIIKRLQLTDDQKQQLRHSHFSYRKAMAELEGQLKVLEVDLENELDKPDPDQTKLDVIVQKIGTIYGQRLSVKIKAELELEKKILTPQQVEQLKAIQGKENPASNEII
jgi:Spy/CpxP family protein refolding chaperone